jgi:hypothetical protein
MKNPEETGAQNERGKFVLRYFFHIKYQNLLKIQLTVTSANFI